jgi:SAM-dependent methyltransferase
MSQQPRPDVTGAAEIESQAAYHRQLFASVYRWDTLWKQAIDMVGDAESAVGLGLDQLGHFGSRGVEIVADRLVAAVEGPLTRVVELGSGFGGALRQLARELKSRGMSPQLIGVELVPEHCALSPVIGRTMIEDCDPLYVNADVRCLPLASASIDAVFAAGSASHFSSFGAVLAECGRVLRSGGVLVMTEEVSLRVQDAPGPGEDFVREYPTDVFYAASISQRRAEIEAAGLTIEAFEPLTDWAEPLLRQRVGILQFMEHCAIRMFGAVPYERITDSLTAAADEYERGSIQPTLIVARRTHPSPTAAASALQPGR